MIRSSRGLIPYLRSSARRDRQPFKHQLNILSPLELSPRLSSMSYLTRWSREVNGVLGDPSNYSFWLSTGGDPMPFIWHSYDLWHAVDNSRCLSLHRTSSILRKLERCLLRSIYSHPSTRELSQSLHRVSTFDIHLR